MANRYGFRPNVLLVVTTQWRGQALGCAGDPNARTPAIDALAAQGIHYRNAVTPHPFGPFARAALLTGVPCPENGVRDYFDPLPRSSRTLAHRFAERGYATAFIGKWHLARRDPAAPLVGEWHAKTLVPPEDRGGFAHWDGFESGFLLNDPWLHGTNSPGPRRIKGYQSDVLVNLAIERMAAAPQPWFCLVSLEAPHPPYGAPTSTEFAALPKGTEPLGHSMRDNAFEGNIPDGSQLVLSSNVPPGGEVERRARQELAGYYRHIAATDRALGRLFEATAADTRIVFTSVHGDMHGAHGLFRKGWPYEESIRVPLIWREKTLPPQSITAPVSLAQLGDFLLAPDAPTGSPFVRISMPSIVRLPDQCDRVWRGIRTSDQKLVLNDDGSPWLYFDLKHDPLERHNLIGTGADFSELLNLLGG